jgi:hypothetical protein
MALECIDLLGGNGIPLYFYIRKLLKPSITITSHLRENAKVMCKQSGNEADGLHQESHRTTEYLRSR